MKNPPPAAHNLIWYGPLCEGEIHTNESSFLAVKNQQGREAFAPVRLLVDTGSNISGIDHSVVKKLKLTPYDAPARVDGVGGIHSVSLYRCVLFLGIFGMKGLPLDVVSGDYRHSPYDGIIGRDVLQFCKFTFDGPGNKFVLEALDF
jgi:predicted aspartyl protease